VKTYGIMLKNGNDSVEIQKDTFCYISEAGEGVIKPRINFSIKKTVVHEQMIYLSIQEAKELVESLKKALDEAVET